MSVTRVVLTCSVLLAVPSASAATFAATAGQVKYVLVHKLHEVEGKSDKVEAVAIVDPAGLKVMARAMVTSFVSGSSNRDAHMLEVLEAARFPWVVVRGAVPGFNLPMEKGTHRVSMQAEVELHGVKVPRKLEVVIEILDSSQARATFAFEESIASHEIEPPNLLFVAVDDALKIEGTIHLAVRP